MNDHVRAALTLAPTYMEMEDAARALDGADVEPWVRRTVNAMRRALIAIQQADPVGAMEDLIKLCGDDYMGGETTEQVMDRIRERDD